MRFLGNIMDPSVVVDDLNFVGIARFPSEKEPPLLVHLRSGSTNSEGSARWARPLGGLTDALLRNYYAKARTRQPGIAHAAFICDTRPSQMNAGP